MVDPFLMTNSDRPITDSDESQSTVVVSMIIYFVDSFVQVVINTR